MGNYIYKNKSKITCVKGSAVDPVVVLTQCLNVFMGGMSRPEKLNSAGPTITG